MSAKKKEKTDWVLCATCDCLFPKNVITQHQKSCQECSFQSFEEFNSTLSLHDTSFIRNNVFYGHVKLAPNEKELKLPNNKSDLILVHPSVLKACSLAVATTVCISHENKQTYGTIWPSSSVQVGDILVKISKLKSLELCGDDLVELQKSSSLPIVANTIMLEASSEEGRKLFSVVSDVILGQLHDTNIVCEDVISCVHYGSEMFFTVKEIRSDFDLQRNVKQENSLHEQMQNLVLDGPVVSTPKKGSTETSCPVIYHVLFHKTTLVLVDDERSTPSQDDMVCMKALQDIGGLSTQKELFDELIAKPFYQPKLYQNCGIQLTHGILLYGPSGTGKSSFVNAYLETMPHLHTVVISGPELTSKYQGETEGNLRNIFNDTLSRAPAILVIDEFDTICPNRNITSNESERRAVATLCSLMDMIESSALFLVVAITNKPESIDLSLRRSGRFDTEVEIGVPNIPSRLDVFQKLFKNYRHQLSESNFKELSEITHGYVGADIKALHKESGRIAMRRLMEVAENNTNNVDELINLFQVTMEDVKNAMCTIGPSAMKEVTIDIPQVHWKDVGGQHDVKQKLREAIEWPLKHPQVFTRMGITQPRGLLMYGPPGCSKTLMAKALATESGLNFISIKGPELFNKYLGESEKAIRSIFHKARAAAPSIVFFDEIDAVAVQRSENKGDGSNASDRVLTQLLTELDGVESLDGVVVVAATNRPDVIDPALLRPGRIDRLIYVPLPDEGTRREIFQIQFRSIPVSADVSLEQLVSISEGYSGAEICSICREAALTALREDFNCIEVKMEHFKSTLHHIKPATKPELIKFYQSFMSKSV